jgi:hypothetical protein
MDERPFREWALERRDGAIIFYEGLFARGVRISAAEAEVYLGGDEGAWSDIIHGRERTEPPRPFWPALTARSAAFPAGFYALGILIGASFVARGTRAIAAPAAVLQSGLGVVVIAFSLYGFWTIRARR